jgi:hypothetical protein
VIPAARRTSSATTPASAQIPAAQRLTQGAAQSAKSHVTAHATSNARAGVVPRSRAQHFASVQRDPAQTVQSAHAETTQADADIASELIARGATTQSVGTMIAVLLAHRGGASINAAAKASGINYRTAQQIIEAAAEHRQRQLVAAC